MKQDSHSLWPKLFSSTTLQIAGRLLVSGTTLFLFALFARRFETASMGQLAFFLSLFNFLDSLSDFGFSPAALRKAAADPAHAGEWIAQARRGRILLCVMAFLGVLLFIASSSAFPWVLVLSAAYLLSHPLALGATVYQRDLRYWPLALIRLAGVSLTLCGCLILFALDILQWEWHLLCFAAGWSFSNLLFYLITERAADKRGDDGPGGSLFSIAWPLGVSALGQQAYFTAGHFFMRFLYGDAALAVYAVPHKGFSFALMAPQYLTATAMPLLARASKENPEQFKILIAQILKLLLWIGLPVAALSFFYAPQILSLLFGPTYIEGSWVLRWLSVAGLAILFGSVAMTGLVAQERTKTVMTISLGTAAVSLPMNYLFTSRWGAPGTAAAVALTEWLVAGIAWFYLKRKSFH